MDGGGKRRPPVCVTSQEDSLVCEVLLEKGSTTSTVSTLLRVPFDREAVETQLECTDAPSKDMTCRTEKPIAESAWSDAERRRKVVEAALLTWIEGERHLRALCPKQEPDV